MIPIAASVPPFNAVECAFGGKFRDRRGARFDLGVLLLRVSGHHYVFLRILHIRFFRGVRALAEFDEALRMCDPRTHAEHYGSVKALRKLERLAGKEKRLRRVRRLEHRNLCGYRVMARVLLVLRRMHRGIVRHADHKSAVHAGIRHCKKRVRGDIHSDMLHRTGASRAVEGRSEGDLHGDLLVGRPFAVYILHLCREFRNLR